MSTNAPNAINIEGDVFIASDTRRLRNLALFGVALFAVFAFNTVDEFLNGTLLSLLPQLVIAGFSLTLTVFMAKRWISQPDPAIQLLPDGFIDRRVNTKPVAWEQVQSISHGAAMFGVEWVELFTGEATAKAHHQGRIARLLSSNPQAVFVDTSTLDLDQESVAELFHAFWTHHAPQTG